jgi:hypothetical protein
MAIKDILVWNDWFSHGDLHLPKISRSLEAGFGFRFDLRLVSFAGFTN